MNVRFFRIMLSVVRFLLAVPAFVHAEPFTDTLVFGDAQSETNHALVGERSEQFTGALGESARRLLPPETEGWQGGNIKFTIKVDPAKQNYFTARFWGGEGNVNRLILFCEGKQIGYRHLGDVDVLDYGGDTDVPAFNGRFFYTTFPLPIGLTRGKLELRCEIQGNGRIWAYGNTFEAYQKPMTSPTRGLYEVYSHTEGFFAPPLDEKQGAVSTHPPVRSEPGAEVLEEIKKRVNGTVNKCLDASAPLNQMQNEFLARAYRVKWTPAYHHPKTVSQVLKNLDATFVAYRKNPRLAEADPATPNADWFGLGPSGDVLRLLAEELKPSLDAEIDDGTGKKISRRAAYSEMLVACRDWHRRHRRLYTNQTMINDLFGIYFANRGVAVVAPKNALPEKDALRYLYESVGLQPWLDSDRDSSGAKYPDARYWDVGENYLQLTAKGLTKELGYVGYYGEVLDWVTMIYNGTRPEPDQPGDAKIKAQLEKIIRARSYFRAPMLDSEGHRAMRIEAVIGWRDGSHYPGDIAYVQRASWDGGPVEAAAAVLDADAIGHAQQLFADNQFFATMKERERDNSFRVTAGLLDVPDDYDILKAQPPSAARLPMSPGQPDFVFSDEEDGVIAIKNGDEIFYASLYWRARNAVNFLARVHFTTPTVDRIAVVREEVEFEPSGLTYTRPDYINFGFARGGPRYPGNLHSALAGEKLPIAKIPAGVKFAPGEESVYAGKGEFYRLQYGNYLIGMNMTLDKTFELKPPAGVAAAKELVSGKTFKLDAPLKVGPRSTVVLWLGK